MRERARPWCWLLIAALLWATVTPSARTQTPPPFTFSDSFEYTFGQQITFSIQASAPQEITSITLYLEFEGVDLPEPHPVALEPGPEVQAGVQRDLRLTPFSPFGEIAYWWEIRDAVGNSLTTDRATFQYLDNRFEWQTLTSDHVRVHTVVDDAVYAQSALNVAQTALERIEQELETPSPEQIDIFVYPSTSDLRAAMEISGRGWAGGQARPELGVALVAIPHDDGAFLRMERDIPHELTHLLVYEAVGSAGYGYVPPWLSEGLATVNEAQPDPALEVVLEEARAEGRLIPLDELCIPFPASRDAALLSYAQSASLVRYIRGQHGNSGLRALLAAYADGASCEGGVMRALSISQTQLEVAWRAHLSGLSAWTLWISDNAPWLLLWGISLLLALPMVGSLRRRAH